MTSSMMMSGLDRLVEAVEATEAASRAEARARPVSRASTTPPSQGFMCPHPGCARLFSKRYNQQAHMRIHDGTRPFLCTLCGKDFMWKSSLKSHGKMHAKLSANSFCTKSSAVSHAVARLPASAACRVSTQLAGLPVMPAAAPATTPAAPAIGKQINRKRKRTSVPRLPVRHDASDSSLLARSRLSDLAGGLQPKSRTLSPDCIAHLKSEESSPASAAGSLPTVR